MDSMGKVVIATITTSLLLTIIIGLPVKHFMTNERNVRNELKYEAMRNMELVKENERLQKTLLEMSIKIKDEESKRKQAELNYKVLWDDLGNLVKK
jgi:uncharacterized protein YlxW (UPF0749 family)